MGLAMTTRARNPLFDDPAFEDAFSGGGHKRNAASLARTIVEFDDRDAVIGLDGKWGSGKSSVIRMAISQLKKIEKKKKFYFFTFDLWANQSEPFRRSFLEKFYEWAGLEKEFESQREFIAEQQRRIGGKIRETETTSRLELTALGAILALVVPLLPILYAWLSPFAAKPLVTPNCGIAAADIAAAAKDTVAAVDCSRIVPLQTFLSNWGMPIAFALSLVIYGIIFWHLRTLKNEHGGWLPALGKLAHLADRKGTEEKKKELIRDVDPTTYEFSKTFREMLSRLQSQKRRIVIVFDNIDRLERRRIATAWSDIQAVLQRFDSCNPERVLTAIVPYDNFAVERALYSDGTVMVSEQRPAQDTKDLYRKSFDAVVHVSQPVISNLNAFFSDKLQDALNGQIDSNEIEKLARIFDLHVLESGFSPTPRQVISFINDLSSLWVDWGDKIPVDAIAVYIANRSKLDAKPDANSIATIAHSSFGSRVSEPSQQLERYLAMLTFGVDDEKLAEEVMLADPIRRALVDSKPDELHSLSANEAFTSQLLRVIDQYGSDIAASNRDYNRAIGNILSLDKKDISNIDDVRRALASSFSSVDSVKLEDAGSYQNILCLPELVRPADIASIAISLSQWLIASAGKADERTETQGQAWIAAIGSLRDSVVRATSKARWDSIQPRISIPVGHNFVSGVARDCVSNGLSFRHFNCAAAVLGIEKRLAEFIGQNDPHIKPKLNALLPVLKNSSKNVLRSAIVDFIKSKNAKMLGIDESRRAIETLIQIMDVIGVSECRDAIQDLIADGGIFTFLHAVYGDQDDDNDWDEAFAYSIMLLVDNLEHSSPSVTNPSQHATHGNIQPYVNWFTALLDRGSYTENQVLALANAAVDLGLEYRFVALAGDKGCARELYRVVAANLLRRDPQVTLGGGAFVTRFERLMDDAKFSAETLLKYGVVVDDRTDWTKIEIDPLRLSSRLVQEVSNADKELQWPKLMGALDAALKNRSKDDWAGDFAQDGRALKLAAIRISRTRLALPVNSFKGPILEHLAAVIEGEVQPNQDLDSLIFGLPAGTRGTLAKDFLDGLDRIVVTASGLEKLLSTAPDFMSQLPFGKNADVALNKIVRVAAENLNDRMAAYLSKNAKSLKKLLIGAGDEARLEVIDGLVNSSLPEESTVDRDGLMKALGLTPPREKNSTDDNTDSADGN